MGAATSDPSFVRIAAAVASEAPRVIVLTAPAGYGKGLFLREYARHTAPLAVAYLPPDPARADLARPVFDALIGSDSHSAGRSAADRLAQRAASAHANSRELLRREWARSETPSLFGVRDVFDALATPAGADLLAELVGTLPPERVLAVSTRTALPPALQQIVERAGARPITAADLALTPAETHALGCAAGLSDDAAAAVYEVARGWPLVSRLLIPLLRSGERVEELREASQALSPTAFLAFAAHRTIVRLDDVLRDALIVTALLRETSHAQLVRILGDACDDLVFARLTGLPFVIRAGERGAVHPEIAAMLLQRFATLATKLYERTLNALTGAAAYVEAAQVTLRRGDVTRAAATIDAAPPYTAAAVPLAEYERILERLDRTLVTRYPNLWIATIPYRSFAVDRATFIREAETVYYCLPATAGPDQRAVALMLLASALLNAGRHSECDRLLDEALRGFALEPSPARASLLNFSAWVHGIEGRFTRARELAVEAARIAHGQFNDTQTLHYIDAHEAAFRGNCERLKVIVDELLRRSDDLPLHRANTAINGAIFTWAYGDDEACLRYIATAEDSLTPGLERGFRPLIDAARGRAAVIDADYLWPVMRAVAELFRFGHASDAGEALRAVRAAARAADERGDPMMQLFAHAALYVLDDGARTTSSAQLERLSGAVESEEMRAAVHALLRGRPAGILEPFLRARVRRERTVGAPLLAVELLSGRVTRDGTPIRLSEKEFELLALLGSAHAALSRDRIGEALWDHLDPEEWANNLKVTLSRLRGKLSVRDAVLHVDGRYRLSPLIEVDVRRSEALVREALGSRLDEAKRNALSSIVTAYGSGAVGRYERFVWAGPLRARIDDLVCGAGGILANDALGHERWDEALQFSRAVTDVDPLNEGACETIVRVLLIRGEIDAARREVHRYTAALASELGATPSKHLTELVRNALEAERVRS
jgi:DNA-binding SARP family transcriptional activator